MTDEIRKLLDAVDAVGALTLVLRNVGARPTIDQHRSTELPCYLCGNLSVPRKLVTIGTYTRRMGGNLQPGDQIDRPLCTHCEELTEEGSPVGS